MNRSVGKGAFVLIVSGFICKLFGALFRLPLTNILGIEGIAIFQMVMSLYSLAIIFVSNGVTSSLAKLVSSSRARGEGVKSSGYLKIGIKYVLFVGLMLGGILSIFSSKIASLQGLNSGRNYYLMLLLLPLGGLIGVYRGILQGHELMTPTAISQIIEQVSRFAFGLSFAYFFGRKGAESGVFGAFLGIVISEVLAFVYLQFVLSKRSSRECSCIEKKEFYRAVLPLSFSSGVIPFTHAIESLMVLPLLEMGGIEREIGQKLYGLQTGMVGVILSFPLLISIAVGTSLLPKVSYLSSTGEHEEERRIVSNAFSIMWTMLVPLVIGLCAISSEFYLLVYPSAIKGLGLVAEGLTYITAISILMAGIMQFLISLLQAKGFFKEVLIFSIIGGCVKIISLILLARIGSIGIYALPISNCLLNITIAICGIIKLYSYVKIDLFNLFLPPLSGLVMFLAVKLLLSSVGGVVGIILSIIAGGGVYLVLTLPLWQEFLKVILDKFKKSKKHLEN